MPPKEMIRFSWSEKRSNDFVNYYTFESIPPGGNPVVMKSPINVPAKVAKEQYCKQLANEGKGYDGPVLHIKLDLASGRMYIPEWDNLSEMGRDQTVKLFTSVKLMATKEFGDIPSAPPIAGDPSKVIRIRTLNDFPSSSRFIRAHLNEESLSGDFMNLPVVEANLSMMPKTRGMLPAGRRAKEFEGCYIDPGAIPTMPFIVEENMGGTVKSRQVHTQQAPFILVNISPEAKVSESDKERVVVVAYKDFATKGINSALVSSVGRYTVKYLLYMGYSFRNVCASVLSPSMVQGFEGLMHMSAYLLAAAKDLKKGGYPDPSASRTYYCFRIDESFPYKFRLNMVGAPYPVEGQNDIITVVHFDPASSYLIFKSPLFFNDDVCHEILKAQGNVVRCDYDPETKRVKTDETPEILDRESKYSTRVITTDLKGAGVIGKGEQPRFELRGRVESQFTKRKITDYYQATDLIKKIIQKINSSSTKQVEFHDLSVVVGPWQRAAGFLGGYMSLERMRKTKGQIPYQPIPNVDWKIMPPAIFIDNGENPSIADQTHVIIHEYRHYLNEQLGVESPTYDVLGKKKNMEDAIQKQLVYLSSPDERESHIEQMQYLLGIGWTKDDIIRQFMGKQEVLPQTIRIARKYLELVNEAARRAAAAEEEAISEDVLQNMLSSMESEEEPA